jgi:hypothetical protein
MAIKLGSTAAELGSSIGGGFVRPLENALDLLARKKLSDLGIEQDSKKRKREQTDYIKNLEGIFGTEMANTIGAFPADERKIMLQNLPYLSQLANLKNQPANAMDYLQQIPQNMQQQGSSLNNLLQEQKMQGSQEQMEPQQENDFLGGYNLEEPNQQAPLSREQILQQLFTPEASKREREKLLLKKQQMKLNEIKEKKKMEYLERKQKHAEEIDAYRETKETRKEIFDRAKAAKETLKDLDRLEELNRDNKLDTPGYVEFLARSGFYIPSLLNPESQEFQKIAANFIQNARSIFGSRISNFELENFLKTIPSLSQSPEGRQRVIANLRYLSKADLAYKEAYKKIVRDNNGKPPLDIDEKIDDMIDGELNILSQKIKEDMAKSVPPGQNKYITGLQAGAGFVLGIPSGLLSRLGLHVPLPFFGR